MSTPVKGPHRERSQFLLQEGLEGLEAPEARRLLAKMVMIDERTHQRICRIALFMIWLIVMTPIDVANALVIDFNPDFNVTVSDVGAVFNFTTDEPAAAKVRYGLEGAITETAESKPPKTQHSVELKGIAASTKFQYYLEARNSTSAVRLPVEEGDFYYFETQAPRDRVAPKAVKQLEASAITRDSITLTWDKDAGDADIDHYIVYKGDEVLAGDVSVKSYTDTGLNFSTEYTYKVSAVDTSDNEGAKTSVTATTMSESYVALTVSAFAAEAVGTNVYVTWTTNSPSHTRIRYGQNPLLLDQQKETPDLVTSHNITLSDLPPNASITLMAESCDEEGSCGNSSAVTVETAEEIELALSVEGLDCDVATASFSNTNRFDARGRASPGAEVNIYINGKRERFKRVTSTGEFSFMGVGLDANLAENEIRVVADDRVNPPLECVDKVMLDYLGPEVQFTNETLNRTFAAQSPVRFDGNITDDTSISAYVYALRPSFNFHIASDTRDSTPDYYLTDGSQTRVTDAVRAVADGIANGTSGRDTVNNIVTWVKNNIKQQNCPDPPPALRSRTAEDILEDKCTTGCIDMGLVTAALARAKGLPAKYVETVESGWVECVVEHGAPTTAGHQCLPKKGHIFTEIYLNDSREWVVVDTPGGSITEKDAEGHVKAVVDVYRQSTMLTIGYSLDSWALGLRSDEDFTAKVVELLGSGTSTSQTRVLLSSENISGSGEFSLPSGELREGSNEIVLEFVDEGGNTFEQTFTLSYDPTPPQIISPTSLNEYSPTYMSSILIAGQVNKPVGEVWIWVNPTTASFTVSSDGSITRANFAATFPEEPNTRVDLQANGTFEAEVELVTSAAAAVAGTFTGDTSYGGTAGTVSTSGSALSSAGTGGAGGQNTIVMIAFDEYGRPSQPITGTVEYTPCGGEYYWSVQLNEGGNVLNTRELLEGIAAYGFGFELEWVGGGDATRANAQNVRITKATVGEREREKYDFDWITEPRVLCRRGNCTKGFVMINFNPQNPEGDTYLERELNLSAHRKGECWPLAGCIRLLLEMQIDSDPAPFMPASALPQYPSQSTMQ
ncbi:hypothetical protein KY359_00090, partial [Candidatus Woesearchaeota archaeon]|nr:hypothetical protein [Candidatus Woesearchaeota archaeon]